MCYVLRVCDGASRVCKQQQGLKRDKFWQAMLVGELGELFVPACCGAAAMCVTRWQISNVRKSWE